MSKRLKDHEQVSFKNKCKNIVSYKQYLIKNNKQTQINTQYDLKINYLQLQLQNINLNFDSKVTMDLNKLIENLKTKEKYKQVKPYVQKILENNKNIIEISIQAIKQIITKSEQAPLLKLYAVRFTKDCFQTANKYFIKLIENQILNQFKKICQDSKSEENFAKFINNFKSDQQKKKIKAEINSLHTITLECIKNWSQWITKCINSQNNAFLKIYQQLQKSGVRFNKENKYFKQQSFRDFELRFIQGQKQKTEQQNNGKSILKKQSKVPTYQIHQTNIKQIISQLVKLQNKNLGVAEQKKQIEKLSKRFDQQLDHYMNKSPEFDQNYINHCVDQFDTIKIKYQSRYKNETPKPPTQQINLKKLKQQQELRKKKSEEIQNRKQLQRKQLQKKRIEKQKQIQSQKKIEKELAQKKRKQQIQKKKQEQMQRLLEIQKQNHNKSKKVISGINLQFDQSLHLENLPEKVDFNLSQESDEDNPKQNNKIPSNIDQEHRRLFKLQEQVKKLSQDRQKLLKKVNNLKNNQQLQQLNQLTKELMIEKRQRFKLSEHIKNLEKKLKQDATVNNNSQQKILDYVNGNILIEQQKPPQNRKRLFKKKNQNIQIEKSEKVIKKIQDNFFEIDQYYHSANRTLIQIFGKQNLHYFKLTILQKSDILFKNSYLEILSEITLDQVEGIYVINLNLKFLTQNKNNLVSKYNNIPQIDLWIKPIRSFSQNDYSQNLILKIEQIPLGLIHGYVTDNQNINKFVLPILFFNFLRVGEVSQDKFKTVFKVQEQNIVKSKILKINPEIVTHSRDFENYFDSYHKLTDKNGITIINIAFLYPNQDKIFLVSIELLINQRIVFRVLELQGQGKNKSQARQLLDNLIFLFTI